MGANFNMSNLSLEILNDTEYKLNGKVYSNIKISDYFEVFEICINFFKGVAIDSKEDRAVDDLNFEVKELYETNRFTIMAKLEPEDQVFPRLGFAVRELIRAVNKFAPDKNLFEILDECKLEFQIWNNENAKKLAEKNATSGFVKFLITASTLRGYSLSDLITENTLLKEDKNTILNELELYKNTQKNKPAIELYTDIKSDFSELERKYRLYFVIAILATLMVTIGYNPLIGIWANLLNLSCSFTYSYFDFCTRIPNPVIYPLNSDSLKFIFFKLGVLAVGVTFTTYFLRLSSFYQLKQEQAKQTQLELAAFPDYVSGMDISIANNLRQELALKYFGKETDKTLIDKNGDLLQDQIKAGTELIKASTDVVKSVKPSGASESSEPK